MKEKARSLSPVLRSGKANCFAAFERLQRKQELEGRGAPPPFPEHRSAPPQAGQFAPLYTLDRGPDIGAHFSAGTVTRFRKPVIYIFVYLRASAKSRLGRIQSQFVRSQSISFE